MNAMPKLEVPRFTFWRGVLLVILALGTYATVIRFFKGLAASTNLSDAFPWGLWIGFDVLCGVALAAGGFTISATVYIFNLEKFRPIVRPAILTAFLGYFLVVVALMFDLGRPWNIWHPLVMWNPHSVMFEVGWCVTLYTTVLALEFSPIVFERFKMTKTLHVLHAVMPLLVILGVLLSTLHQSSLGSFYLIVPTKLHALWYSPLIPLYFFLTALTLGCAMTIVESFLSHRAFGKQLEMELLVPLGRVALLILALTSVIRFADFRHRGILGLAFQPTYESRLFLAEMLIGVLAPGILLAIPKVRKHTTGLFLAALLIVMGVVLNRLNVSITGMERSSGSIYVPALTEVAITLSVVGVGFLIFALAVKFLPVFPEHEMKEARPDRRPRRRERRRPADPVAPGPGARRRRPRVLRGRRPRSRRCPPPRGRSRTARAWRDETRAGRRARELHPAGRDRLPPGARQPGAGLLPSRLARRRLRARLPLLPRDHLFVPRPDGSRSRRADARRETLRRLPRRDLGVRDRRRLLALPQGRVEDGKRRGRR